MRERNNLLFLLVHSLVFAPKCLQRANYGMADAQLKESSSSRSERAVPREPSRGLSALFANVRGSIFADRLGIELTEGDIVLFKGKQAHDGAIRCCTASEFNHVGVIVENGGELEIFEATAAGVCTVPLNFYIDSYYWSHMRSHFHKVVVRKVSGPSGRGITKAMRAELVRYQEEMIGRRFKANPVTYMKALLEIKHKEDMRSVFCSQLVSGAYKRMGLLHPDKSASAYFPRDFSQERTADLPLIHGARLGRELTVRFDDSPNFAARSSIVRPAAGVGASKFDGRRSTSLGSLSAGFREARASILASVALAPSPTPPAEPTAEEMDARKEEANAMLDRAMAINTVRVYAQRWRRARERRESRLQSPAVGVQRGPDSAAVDASAASAASAGEVQIRVLRD